MPPPTDQQTEPHAHPGSRRVRRAIFAGAVVVLLAAATTTYLSRRGHDAVQPDDAAYGVVKLSADPGPRWQVQLARIAPDLRCPSDPRSLNPRVDLCVVTDSVVSGDTVVVDVQREQRTELVGVARADGAVRWHRSAPAGSVYDCLAVHGRLWCTTTPLEYSMLKPDSGYPQLLDVTAAQSTKFTTSLLTEIEPRTGAVLHSAALSKSANGAVICGVGVDGLYLVAGDSTAERSPMRITRVTAEGAFAWAHDITLVDGGPTQPHTRDQLPSVRVYEVDGKASVNAAQSAGRQAVFDIATGTATGGPGHVVTVTAGTVVTSRNVPGLVIGNTGVNDADVAGFAADDRSADEPVLTTRAEQPPGSPGVQPVTAYTIRSVSKPGVSRGRIGAGEAPLAYCGGVVVTTAGTRATGYDARSGARIWGDSFGNPGLRVRCDAATLLVADGSSTTGYDVRTGRRSWSLDAAQGTELVGGGLGDPGTGLVLGPQSRSEVGVSTALTFVH